MTQAPNAIAVGIGEVKGAARSQDILVAYGLGSCVAVCAYDLAARVGGLAHIMLPESQAVDRNNTPGKFADTAIPFLVERMMVWGAKKGRLKISLAGGAQMINLSGSGNRFRIGERNVLAVATVLDSLGLRLTGSDTGGQRGRTVRLSLATGGVTVHTAGQEPRERVLSFPAGEQSVVSWPAVRGKGDS